WSCPRAPRRPPPPTCWRDKKGTPPPLAPPQEEGRVCRVGGAPACWAHPPISPSFSPARLRSGPRWSNSPARKWTKSGSPPPHVRGNAMKLRRRNFLHLAAGAAALPAVSRVTWAQAYPSRPVRIIVGFAAGGATDILARLLGQVLSERLGQQFVIENRTGAATNIATEAVVRAPPDGYTLLLVVPANAISATLYDNLNFNFIRHITP